MDPRRPGLARDGPVDGTARPGGAAPICCPGRLRLTRADCACALQAALFAATYSIVTASRPINWATSSKCFKSFRSMARARRATHSSSLNENMSSFGTIDGIESIRSAPTLLFIESISVKPGMSRGFRPIESIWRRGRPAARGLRGAPKRAGPGVRPTSKCRCNLLRHQGFPHPETIANMCEICPMQAEKALLYAARSRTFVSLIPR